VRTTRLALGGATLWSLALVVAALTVPVYSGETTTADSTGATTATATSTTLVGENGWWGLVVAGLPLVACLVVGALLLGPGGRTGKAVAVVVVAVLGVGTLLGLLSIGIFVLPVTVALAVAVATADHSRGPAPFEGQTDGAQVAP
jgi:hypothetical protein